MSKVKLAVFAIGLAASIAVFTSSSQAKPEYTKAEKKACQYCHIDSKSKPKELTDAGKYYQEHGHSLEGYQKK